MVVAILSWNKVGLLRTCLASLMRDTEYPHTVCVVDQGSTDGTRRYLESLGDRVVPLYLPENVGFIQGNNLVMERFPDHDVVLLNNDTQVQPGWLTALADRAYSAPKVGIVGAKLIYPDGRLQEAGGEIFQDGTGRNIGKMEDADRRIYNQVRQVDYCSGACLYIKREVLDRVGSLDERYDPAYCEDSDLCLAAAAAGYQVLYEPTAVVVHLEGGTAGKSEEQASRSRALQECNRPKFVAKWGHVLATKRRSMYELPATPGRDTLLFIGPFVPMHDTASGELRWFLTIQELARDHDIVYVGRNTTPCRYVNELEALGVTVFAPDPERMRLLGLEVPGPYLDLPALLTQNRFLAVVVGFYHLAHQYAPIIRKHTPHTCLIVDTHDIHYLRAWRKAELTGEAAHFWEAEEEKRRELRVYRRADLVLTVTAQDRQALLNDAPDLEVRLAPNIHDAVVEADDVPEMERKDLVFVGGFRHPPNEDAMLWFCNEIMPRIHAALPDVRLHIVGSEPTPAIQQLAGPNVMVTGYVPSVLPYLRGCRISVAPLRYGAGMKGKVGEALSAGIPLVTTTSGAEGMGLEDGRHALVADGAAAFADAVIRLYQDPGLRARLVAEGRRLVAARYGRQAVGGLWRATLERAKEIVARKAIETPSAVAQVRGGIGPLARGGSEGYAWLLPRPRIVPTLTIVIPVHNALAFTQQCVETIRRYTEIPYRLVLVDNGSTDGTPDWADAVSVECLTLPENRGFAAGCNAGIRGALSDYVILLNNDTILSPGWAERLLDHLDRGPAAGLVGPSTNYASSRQQIDAQYTGLDEYLRFAERIAREHKGQVEEVDRLVAVCLAARRRLFEEVGLLDERFGLGNYEDDDLCLRVRMAGYRLLWAKDVYLHHIGSQTFAAVQVDYDNLLRRNREVLRRKWDVRTHAPERLRHLLVMEPAAPSEREASRPQTDPDPETMGRVLAALQAGRWEEALQSVEPLGRAFPATATIQGCWGQALWRTGRPTEAEARLRRAVSLAPRDRGWVLLLVQLLLEAGRHREALAEVEAAGCRLPEDDELTALANQLRERLGMGGNALAGAGRSHG